MKAAVNGAIVLPDKILEGSALLFDDRIRGVVPAADVPADARIIDAEGGYILPGFVDVHVHGGGGADFLDGSVQAVRTVTRCHGSHGTTSILPTTLTCSNEVFLPGVKAIVEAMEAGQDGAEILGLHLEGPYFSSASKGAQAVSEERHFTPEEAELFWQTAKGHIVRWDAAPELPASRELAEWIRTHGVWGSVGHSACNAETALWAFSQGYTHVTHMYCATTTEHKENGVVHGGLIEAAYLEDGFTVELISDGKHIPRETMLVVFKLKGADRIALITDAMRAAGQNVTESILGPLVGGSPVIVEDGVAKVPDRSVFAGSICTMDRALRTAVGYGVPLTDAVRSASLTPARLAGFADRKGSLEPGKDADVVITDRELFVKKVFFHGREGID